MEEAAASAPPVVGVVGFINNIREFNSDMHTLSGCVVVNIHVCHLKPKRQTQVGNPPPAALEEQAASATPVAGVVGFIST